jgi:hypothetical protein
MSVACSTIGEDERCAQGLVGKAEEGDNFEDVGIEGRTIIKWVCKKWNGSLDWIALAQIMDIC